jgi:hypothetical protein
MSKDKKPTPEELAKIGATSEIEKTMNQQLVNGKAKKPTFEQTIKAMANTPAISNKEIAKRHK